MTDEFTYHSELKDNDDETYVEMVRAMLFFRDDADDDTQQLLDAEVDGEDSLLSK